MATTGFILSLVGLLCCGFIFGAIGAVLGFMALNEQKRTGNQQGRGLAIAAIVIGIIGFIIHIIVVPLRWHMLMRDLNSIH
jgi:uncharacterized membrane protein